MGVAKSHFHTFKRPVTELGTDVGLVKSRFHTITELETDTVTVIEAIHGAKSQY